MMSQSIHHYFSIFVVALCIGGPLNSFGQSAGNPYFIDGEEVVFVFDIRTYTATLTKVGKNKVDFGDLKINEVAVSGDFNGWSKQGWKMQRRSEYLFELRKKITEFNDPFPVEFKYIINGKYIAAPDGNPDSRQFTDDFLEEVYKIDLSVLTVHQRGNILFELKGYANAREVILTGSFNGWDEHSIKMNKGEDGWFLRAHLPPGRYEYKFIVDDTWHHDPRSKENVTNEHGTLNSVLNVTIPVVFTLEGFPNAKSVILTGSFADWNERKFRMTLVNGVWKTTVPLTGGKHHYKYIIDGGWRTDPSNPIVEDDGYGNQNSVIFVH